MKNKKCGLGAQSRLKGLGKTKNYLQLKLGKVLNEVGSSKKIRSSILLLENSSTF
jgi:hypothetical protein